MRCNALKKYFRLPLIPPTLFVSPSRSYSQDIPFKPRLFSVWFHGSVLLATLYLTELLAFISHSSHFRDCTHSTAMEPYFLFYLRVLYLNAHYLTVVSAKYKIMFQFYVLFYLVRPVEDEHIIHALCGISMFPCLNKQLHSIIPGLAYGEVSSLYKEVRFRMR